MTETPSTYRTSFEAASLVSAETSVTEFSDTTGLPKQTPREAIVQGPVSVDVSVSPFARPRGG